MSLITFFRSKIHCPRDLIFFRVRNMNRNIHFVKFAGLIDLISTIAECGPLIWLLSAFPDFLHAGSLHSRSPLGFSPAKWQANFVSNLSDTKRLSNNRYLFAEPAPHDLIGEINRSALPAEGSHSGPQVPGVSGGEIYTPVQLWRDLPNFLFSFSPQTILVGSMDDEEVDTWASESTTQLPYTPPPLGHSVPRSVVPLTFFLNVTVMQYTQYGCISLPSTRIMTKKINDINEQEIWSWSCCVI